MRDRVEARATSAGGTRLLLICYAAFVSLGLPDTLIGIAWPSVRRTFALQQGELSWIFFGSGCSYFVSSFFAGRLLKAWNTGLLLAASSSLVSLSAFNYSGARVWPLFAAGALLHGLGSGAIDSALNHYAASHFSARHMNWLHASYSVGAMLGPIIMTLAINEAGSWRMGYAAVGAALFALAVLFFISRRQWDDGTAAAGTAAANMALSAADALRRGTVWLHIALFFVYTGTEVAIGQWAYSILTESRGIPPGLSGGWVSLYWGSILAGRIVFGLVVERIGVDLLVRASTVVAVAGAALFCWNPVEFASPAALSLCGLGLAVIFPCLMTRTPQRVGQAVARHAVGFQVGAAMLGAALLPSMAGWIAQGAGLKSVPGALLAAAILLFLLHELLLWRDRNRTASDSIG